MPLGSIMLVVCRADDTQPPIELSSLQYIDFSNTEWQFALCRSIELKHEQMKIPLPSAASEFIEGHNNNRRIFPQRIIYDQNNTSIVAEYFTYARNGRFWDLVNAEIRADVLRNFFKFDFEGRAFSKDAPQPVSWSLEMREHYLQEGFLSLNFYSFWDYGGPHPNRGIYTLNFDESAGGRIKLNDLFGYQEKVLRYLKDAVESDVRHQTFLADGEPSDYSLDQYVNFEGFDGWKTFAQWNASQNGLTIFLSQHSGLPFVMGVFGSTIPWTYLRNFVSDQYRDTYICKIMQCGN